MPHKDNSCDQDDHLVPKKGWSYSSPKPPLASFRLELTEADEMLKIHFAFPPDSSGLKGATKGDYVEGLWEADVAEFFLAKANTDGSFNYLEINVSPEGAWWSMEHHGIRQRSQRSTPLTQVEITSPSPHQISIAFPIPSLPSWANPALPNSSFPLLANATFILKGADGNNNYLSWCDLPGDQPDFHQPQSFIPLQKLLR